MSDLIYGLRECALSSRQEDAAVLRDAADAIERVLALHAPERNIIYAIPPIVCVHRYCVDEALDQIEWPCPTVKAIQGGGTNVLD